MNKEEVSAHRFEGVLVLLDYDKAEAGINFDLESDKPFSTDKNVKIKASFSILKIDTQPHPPQFFFTRGKLESEDKTYELHGTGN